MSFDSAEVAADFKSALQDLKTNNRVEISTLTIIAKENTEHAQAISRELENHINTTRPEYKLFALFVLDSIVKNVGTPYTVYLGRNLYKTFMDAYSYVDPNTRKAMEGLFKTWKQPVPDSMDPNPVFPNEATRQIESALIKFRTVAIQHANPPLQHRLPPRPPNAPWRNTPTPPQNANRYTPSNDPRLRQFQPQFPPPATPPNQFPSPSYNQHQQSTSVDVNKLKYDLNQLIKLTQGEWASDMADQGIQHKLKALVDLSMILNTQTPPPEQLVAIQAQIQQMSPSQAPQSTLPTAYPPPQSVRSPQLQSPPQPPSQFPPTGVYSNLAQILANANANTPPSVPQASTSTTNLAEILRRTTSPAQGSATPAAAPSIFPPQASVAPTPPAQSSTQVAGPQSLAQLLAQFKPSASPTPPMPQPPPAQATPLAQLVSNPPVASPSGTVGSANWLLSALKASNLLSLTGTPLNPPAGSTPISSAPMTRSGSVAGALENDVELTTASLKKSRPNLISKLYSAISNQCQTCGRRFENTALGKERKARHMDWHFKVKDPDLAKRGVHRSWYITEREWIDYREVDEASPEQSSSNVGSSNSVAVPKKEAKDRYILVPEDKKLQDAPCLICQEKFQTTYNAEAEDFVWMDAVMLNGKVYHATCWEEYSRGSGTGGAVGGSGTPDSVLGKRKATEASYLGQSRGRGW